MDCIIVMIGKRAIRWQIARCPGALRSFESQIGLNLALGGANLVLR